MRDDDDDKEIMVMNGPVMTKQCESHSGFVKNIANEMSSSQEWSAWEHWWCAVKKFSFSALKAWGQRRERERERERER